MILTCTFLVNAVRVSLESDNIGRKLVCTLRIKLLEPRKLLVTSMFPHTNHDWLI